MKLGLVGTAGIVCGGLYMSGVFTENGEIYPIPAAQVRATVASLPAWQPLSDIFSSDMASTARVSTDKDGSPVWRFTRGGHELGVVRAVIKEEGPAKTRITIKSQPGDDLANTVPIGKVIATPLVQHMIELAMAEQVDAALEKRPFDKARLNAATRQYVSTHLSEAAEFRRVAQETLMSGEEPAMMITEEAMRPAEVRSGGSHVARAQFGTSRPMIDAKPMTEARPMVDVRPSDSRYR